jgi:ribose transport system substrate-binding protein
MQGVVKCVVGAAGLLFAGGMWSVGAAGADEYNDGQSVKYYDTMKGKKVIAIVVSSGLDVAQGFTAGLIGQARDLGYSLSVRDYNWDTSQGAQAVSLAIAEKPDVLAVMNFDYQAFSSLLSRAVKQGTKIVQVLVKSTATTDAYVGPDWYQMDLKNIRKLVDVCNPKLGKSGKIAILQGTPNNPDNFMGMKAAEDVLAEHPEIQVVSTAPADWDATKAHGVAEIVLKQNPDLCGYLGFWDGQDIGMAAAVKEAGKKGKIFVTSTGSAQPAACDLVKDGSFDYYISYDIQRIAQEFGTAVSIVLQQSQPAGSQPFAIYVPSRELSAANIQPGDCVTPKEIAGLPWK